MEYTYKKIDDINFYSFCFANKQPKMTLPNQKNIMLGTALHHQYNYTYYHDDTGDNISTLNHWFGQTTGLYWVWKNIFDDYVGVCTYRLFWKEDDLRKIDIDENTLVIPKVIHINATKRYDDPTIYTTLSHFTGAHGELPICFLYYLAKINKLNITVDMIDDLGKQDRLYPFNMFIANKKVFNKVCELLFDTLFKLYDHFSHLFEAHEKKIGQKRLLDFLAERILHIIYTNIDHFIPGIKIRECEIIDLPH